MKRHLFLFALALILMAGSIVHAQDPTQTPAGQRQGGARGGGGGQRQGAAPQPEAQREYSDVVNGVRWNQNQALTTLTTATITTAWWSNTQLVAKLGLTDVQKSKIESTFEAHRQNLATRKDQLEKEETQLSKLLDAESIDRGSIFTQINRVIQARGEMERENATMTLEMREQLTRAQWTQLQASQPTLRILTARPVTELPLYIRTAPVTGGGGRGPIAPQQ